MTIAGLPTPYASNTEADAVNASAAWIALDEDVKTEYLQWARVYIDDYYSCTIPDATNAPDSVKTANAILAENHITTPLFDTATTSQPQKGLTERMVKAEGVTSSKKYDANYSNNWVDPFPNITALVTLNAVCALKKGGSRSVPLVRR